MFLLQDINGQMNLSGDGSVTLVSDGRFRWERSSDVLRTLRVCVGGCEAGMQACLQ